MSIVGVVYHMLCSPSTPSGEEHTKLMKCGVRGAAAELSTKEGGYDEDGS